MAIDNCIQPREANGRFFVCCDEGADNGDDNDDAEDEVATASAAAIIKNTAHRCAAVPRNADVAMCK